MTQSIRLFGNRKKKGGGGGGGAGVRRGGTVCAGGYKRVQAVRQRSVAGGGLATVCSTRFIIDV